MRQFKLNLAFLLTTILAFSIYLDAAPPNEVPGETIARMAKLGEEFATPNEHHAFLARFSGEWTTSSTVMGLPQEEGKASYNMILGGRFLNGDISGTFANVPYIGRVTIGYDNYKHKFVATFLDDLGTSLRTAQGMLDRTGNILSLWGTMDEWMTDEHDKPIMYRFILIDEDNIVFEVHDLAIDLNSAVITTTYKKVTQVEEI